MTTPALVTVLLVVGPLFVGAVLGGASVTSIGRRLADPVALTLAVAVTGAAVWDVGRVSGGTEVVWPGGWSPSPHRPLGVALVMDRPAGLLICLVGVLTVAALTYSWRFLADAGPAYLVLVLLFLGACDGFVLAGDVFDAFVWFELMGVAAYALTGMRIEEPRSVHGALSFGVVNTVGASLSLTGIALLYARTGALNLAAMGQALRSRPEDHLVAVACALLLTGVLVKMALVPFHFWTADAEAVAPTPVCVLLSGAMVTVGAFAVARWWWVVFEGSVPDSAVRHALVGFGAVTAVVGAVMCAAQRHLKRLLAYSTVAHSGVIALGIGLLTGPGVAAAGLYAVGHACAKGALFLVTGVLLNRFETLDEHELFRRGRGMWVCAATFIVGGLSLAGLPPLGTWAGKAALSTALDERGLPWLEVVVVLVSAMTGGAVVRAGLRIFLGWGDRPEHGPATHEQPEGDRRPDRRLGPRVLLPPVALLVLAAAMAVLPRTPATADVAGAAVVDRARYVAAVLRGALVVQPGTSGESLWSPTTVVLGLVATGLALLVAAMGLFPARVPAGRRVLPLVRRGVRLLHQVHRAHVGDYVSWVLIGFTVLGATLLLS